MLSTENHNPSSSSSPDPSPCTPPSHFPPPKLISPTKPTATDTSCGPLSDRPEVDLPHPRSNFSIRDYVLTARSKDIQNNWPFSLKSLHLCLKNGVKDVLPPFQSLDDVRNQSLETFTVGTRSFVKHSIGNSEKEKPSRPDSDYAALPDSSNNTPSDDKKLAEPNIYNSSCQSELVSDFLLARTSASQSEIESVIPPDHSLSKSLPFKSGTLLKVSAEVEALGPHTTKKNERTSRPLGKKCRLIVKFGGNSDRSSTEDIASNCTTAAVSDSMASKVCPVCKTFSSSSNTTLNAHIDQCLSKESAPEWMCGSKLTRHRIKPRKTRLMVDIYVTAQRCTLEDLDQRNGTSWATASSLPTHQSENNETPNDAKKQKLFPVHPQDAGAVGLVYVDANGTKVRILSNLNGLSPSALKEGNDIGAKRPLKGSKYTSKKKKKQKRLAHKHQKYLKLAPQGKKCFSHKVQGSQIVGHQKAYNGKEKNGEDDGQVVQRIKLADSGSFRPWLHAKRRGCTKKIIRQGSLQPLRCQWHLPQDLLVENDQSLFGGSLVLENHAQKITDTSGNVLLSPGNNQRKERLHHKAQFDDKGEQAPKRKRVGSSMVATTNGNNAEGLFLQRKRDAEQFGINKSLICGSDSPSPPNSTGIHKCSPGRKPAGIQDATQSSDVSPSASSKLSCSSQAIVTKAKRFSSFRRNILSAGGRLLLTESGQSEVKNWPDLQKSSLHVMRRKDKDLASQYSEGDQEHVVTEDYYENQFRRGGGCAGTSRVRATVLENRERIGLLHTSQRDNAFAFKRSIEKGNDVNSSVKVGNGYLCKIDCSQSGRHQVQVCEEDLVIESSSRTCDGRNTTNLSKFVDSHFCMPSHSFRAQSNSFQAIEGHRGRPTGSEALAVPTEPHIVNNQHMFSGNEVENGLIGRNDDLPAELDSEARRENVFPEVDPIPIPSPPGSYLPSPRDMGSEDFQGNSSLTTSQVQSSPDPPDVVDGDSSESTIYVASTISNAMQGISDPKYCESVAAVRPIGFEDRTRSGSSGLAVASVDLSIQNSGGALQMTSAAAEGPCFFEEYSKLNNVSAGKESFIFKNDQPCCCQRKETFSQGVGLYYQESQLLRRRMMPPLSIPAAEKQVGYDASTRHPKLDRRLELVPPSICPTSGSGKLAPQFVKIPAGLHPFNNSPNVGARSLALPDCSSTSPSASNPILRLMGKNLMVVNKDEESSTPIEQVQPSVPHGHCVSQNMHQTSQLPAYSIVSPANNPNQNFHAFHHAVSQSVYSEDHHSAGEYFDVGLSGSSGSHPDPKSPEELVRLPTIMFRGQHRDYGFATPVEPCEHKGDYSVLNLQSRLEHRLSLPFTMGKAVASPDNQCRHTDSTSPPVKEIIIIDDSAESETTVVNDGVKGAEGWRVAQAVSAGTPIATFSNFNPSRVYPFSCYQSTDCPPRSESPAVKNVTFHAMASMAADTSAVWWGGCSTDGSDVVQRANLTSSSSAGHLRSPAVYYSPGYS